MARDFNGTTDRIDWNNIANPVGGNLTISGWIYLDAVAHSSYIFAVHNSTNTAFSVVAYIHYIDATYFKPGFVVNGSTLLTKLSQQKITANYTGGWHHYLVTWDGSVTSNNVHIYLDGVEGIDDTEVDGITLTAGTGSWSLGGRINDDLRNFDGMIDEVGVWNRVLDAGEIASLASGRMPRSIPSGLIFDANLDKGSLVDSVTSSTGTADGTTVFEDHILYVPLIDTSSSSEDVTYSIAEEIKSIADSGLGIETYSLQSSLSISDIGEGDKGTGVEVILTIFESGVGEDTLRIFISGTTVWGHQTGVTETNIRAFSRNWTGTGSTEGSGDDENLTLDTGQYMESEIVYTGAVDVELFQNSYGGGLCDTVTLKYRTGSSLEDCEAASWNVYSASFTSLGFVQLRVEF